MASAVIQQINLYQDEFRSRTEWLSGANLIKGVALLAVLLATYSGLIFMSFSGTSSTYAKAQHAQKELEAHLQTAREAYPPRAKDKRLAEQVAALEVELDTKRRVIDTLSERSFGNTDGFAEHFSALARQRLDGLWLTTLVIDEGGTEVGIKGGTLEPELVPRYLQRLSAEQVFAGTEFKRLLMQRPEDDRGRIEFDLNTRLGAQS